jgi:transcriptional regulator with XRE-family HTH domain
MADAAGPQPSPDAARLARRLRDLREREFIRLTQDELGRALGGGDKISPATISVWENPAGGRLPPLHRIQAYAQLFCTGRSFDGVPHLIPEDQLTDGERATMAELAKELLDLRARTEGVRAEVAQRSMWHFPGAQAITIVCGLLPEDRQPPNARHDDLDYSRIARFADLDTLVDVYGAVKANNPDSVVILTTGREMTRVDALNHLILIGNTEMNQAMRWFARQLDLPVTVDASAVVIKGERFGYTLDQDELIEDVGVFVRGPHPSAPHLTVTICNGITSRGVRGAAQCFVNSTVRERNTRYTTRRFPEESTFGIVVRVPVLNGEPLPQVLEEEANRLHEWHS